MPYWLPLSFHQAGVKTPRLSPKSPGEVQVPITMPLIETVISDGQSAAVPGTSEESSIENSSSSIFLLASLALLGNLYSKNPRVNQINPACIRSGSKKA